MRNSTKQNKTKSTSSTTSSSKFTSWAQKHWNQQKSYWEEGKRKGFSALYAALILGTASEAAGLTDYSSRIWQKRQPSPPPRIETVAIAKQPAEPPPDTVDQERRKRADQDCLVRRNRDIAAYTTQRAATLADYSACQDESRPPWISAEERCKARHDTYQEFKRKLSEAQSRTCVVSK